MFDVEALWSLIADVSDDDDVDEWWRLALAADDPISPIVAVVVEADRLFLGRQQRSTNRHHRGRSL